MAWAIDPYPADHGLALARALRVVDLLSARPDLHDKEVEAALVGEGVGPVDAWLLTLFVPSALTYPVIRQLGESPGSRACTECESARGGGCFGRSPASTISLPLSAGPRGCSRWPRQTGR